MSENNEPPTCVRCQRQAAEKDKYCISCGAPLYNRCSDEPGLVSKGCKYVNHSEAAYCAKCGEETTFKKAGLISPFVQKNQQIHIK